MTINRKIFPLSIIILAFILQMLPASFSLIIVVVLLFLGLILLFTELSLFIVYLLVLFERIAMLMPVEIVVNNINFSFYDLPHFLIFIFVFVRIISMKNIKLSFKNPFILISLSWIILVLIAAFNASIVHNQGILLGIFTQRRMLVYFSAILLIHYAKSDINLSKKISTYIISFGKLYTVLYLIQYGLFIFFDTVFLNIKITERIGFRFGFEPVLLTLFILVMINEFVQKKSYKNMLWIFLSLSIILFFAQLRMLSFALILSLLVLFITNTRFRTVILKKSYIFIPAIILMIPMLVSFINYTDSNDPSISRRQEELDFYIPLLEGNWVIGNGVLNDRNGANELITGSAYRFFLNDLGVFEIIFYYGLIGVSLFYFMMIILLYRSILILRIRKNVFPILYTLFTLISSITVLHFYNYSIFFLVYLIYTENEYYNALRIDTIGGEINENIN